MEVIKEEYLLRTMYNKSLYKFMRDFWSTCDSQKFKGSVLTEYMTECFMYSVKHLLPEGITEDWIKGEEIEQIIEKIKRDGIIYSTNYEYKDSKVVGVFDKYDYVKEGVGEVVDKMKVNDDGNSAFDAVNYSFMKEWLTDDDVYGLQAEGFLRKSVIKKLSPEDVEGFLFKNFFEDAQFLKQHNLNLPPSHTKSKSLNVMAGAWLFSIMGAKLVSLSHTGSLASDFNGQRQRIIKSELWKKVFPSLRIIKDTSDSLVGNHFGELFSQPFLHMTGKHMDVAVLDDLVDAHNTLKIGENLKNALSFMQHTLPTRKNDPKNSVLWNVMQRLAPGDVTGWILQNQKGLWTQTVMPARAVDREIYIFPVTGKVWVRDVREADAEFTGAPNEKGVVGGVRIVGDYLWPEQFGDYSGIEAGVGSAIFNTQHQQNPAGADKTVIKVGDIQYADAEEIEYFSQVYASHDLPFKGGDTNDLHGSLIAFSRDGKLYIDDADEKHRAYKEQKEWIMTIANAYPGVLQIVEDKANGPAVIDDLRNLLSGTLIPFNPGMDDKYKRAEIARVYMNNVYFLRHGGMVRENCQVLITRLLEFPFVKYKDIVDSFTMLLLYFFVDVQFSVFYKSLSDSNIIQIDTYLNEDKVQDFKVRIDSNHKYIVTMVDGTQIRYNTIDGAVLKYGNIWKMIKVAITYAGGIFTVIDSKTIHANIQEAQEIMVEFFKGVRLVYDPNNNLSGIIRMAKLQPTPETDQDEFITLVQSGLAKNNLRFLSNQSEVLSDIKQVRWNKELMAKGERIMDYTNNYSVLITGIISATRGKMPF